MRLVVKAHEAFVLLCKKPQFYCQSVASGEVLDVGDELGAALLAQYPAHLAVVEAEKVEAKAKPKREKA
jgi:hypothetical protein